TPNPASAESTAGKACPTAPVAVPDVSPIEETPVPKGELPVPPPGPSATPTTGASAGPTGVPTQAPTVAPTAQPSAPVKTPAPAETPTVTPTAAATSAPATAPAVKSVANGSAGTVSAVYQGDANGTAKATQAGLIDDIVGGINNLLNPGGSASPTPSASPTATPAPATTPAPAAPAPAAPAPRVGTPVQPGQPPAPAAQPPAQPQAQPSAQVPDAGTVTQAPKPSATGKAPTKPAPSSSASATPSGSAAPSAPSSSASPTASATASPTANPNCTVDARNLTAAAAPGEHVVPQQNWTLQTSRLGLYGSAFHGVYDVKTPTGTKRVLKFVVSSVDIENLDMSTLEGNGVTFHVQGAPGSTSTMRNGPVTMYVERLSGHLSKALGLPIPIDLGEITLTPDTLPRWLYDLIGSIPVPLDLELTGVTAKQAGQFGGTLHIPGMHLFNDNAPYSDK
ncbi:hypothetical protein, partial [Kitasatospora sp. NPDC093558]|uniref:hypothetical protein n=1 Tax=Kitasatospora sp. NPDC093558 TaxID=3155201 RepID=UPI003440D3AB